MILKFELRMILENIKLYAFLSQHLVSGLPDWIVLEYKGNFSFVYNFACLTFAFY